VQSSRNWVTGCARYWSILAGHGGSLTDRFRCIAGLRFSPSPTFNLEGQLQRKLPVSSRLGRVIRRFPATVKSVPRAVSEVSTLLTPNRSLEAHNSFKKVPDLGFEVLEIYRLRSDTRNSQTHNWLQNIHGTGKI
jgi:hypothetical protein